MTSRVVIEITVPDSIEELNSQVQVTGNAPAAAQNIINFLKRLLSSGETGSTIQVTTRGTSASVGTNGTSSTQKTHTV